jgi:hypothetical protein
MKRAKRKFKSVKEMLSFLNGIKKRNETAIRHHEVEIKKYEALIKKAEAVAAEPPLRYKKS